MVLFQPLDLTVNSSKKASLKKKFTEWYSSSISKQLEEGKSIEGINVELKLSILKPLHAKWINELCVIYMTSEEGRKVMSHGWKATFITEAIEQGAKGLEPLDLLFDIDPLINEDKQTILETLESITTLISSQRDSSTMAVMMKTNGNLKEYHINNILDILIDDMMLIFLQNRFLD